MNPTQIDILLHNTRAHSTDGWRKLSKSLTEISDDDRLLIEYAPTLRAEVERLRNKLNQIRNIAKGAIE
jgi:polyhydroxyalkanoate synthesis regulator phasin